MKNQELTQLVNQLKQALGRLSAQEGKSLAMPVSQRVTTTNHKRSPISRFDVDHIDTVDIETLEHAEAVQKGEDIGLCIRLIFDGRLYAVHGESAETLKFWVERVGKAKAHQRIDKMPNIVFQNVEGRVKIFNGELLAA